MSGYQGMRWFKCDLQVQTPEDGRHWDLDDPLLLTGSPPQRDEQELQEKARQYLRRCHEVGLEIIGVTDHNFCAHREPRKRFLTHLIEQNRAVARDLGLDPLWIFPGFEVDIGYHLLCLFPPERTSSSRLDAVCDVLTKLGLPPSSRFDAHGVVPLRRDGREVSLSEVLRIVQEEHGGIVIAAHAFQDNGIASESRGARDYQNENLLCVEATSFPLRGREKVVLDAKEGAWFRSRPLAYIRSSDAKSTLLDAEGHPKPNSLGYRWTWIKMSEPSIEALRQAFLDSDSRINLDMAEDLRVVRHSRIESLSVSGTVFLDDQQVHFSPGLNCIIGGRGAGKSTLFEYLRFCLRREDVQVAERQIRRIRGTLTPDSLLRLKWRSADTGPGQPGSEDLLEFASTGARARIASRDVVDPATVFRNLDVQIFSQGQITETARRPEFLLSLFNELVGDELRTLQAREAELREQIRQTQEIRRTLERLESEDRMLDQEVQDLDRQWQARAAIQEEQRRHRSAQEARRWLDQLGARTEETAASLERKADEIVDADSPLGSSVRNWPEPELFEGLDVEVERARQELASSIRSAAQRYRATIAEKTTGSEGWSRIESAIRRAEEEFREACSRQGLQPEELDRLLEIDRLRRAKTLELEAKRAQLRDLARRVEGMGGLVASLHGVWREQTRIRQDRIGAIVRGDAVPKVPIPAAPGERRPSVEIQVSYCGDEAHFLELWMVLSPDGRNRLGRRWEEIGKTAFQVFRESGEAAGSPWQVVEDWVTRRAAAPTEVDLDLLAGHLTAIRDRWERTVLERVRDATDLLLYRPDGSLAGTVARGQLSEGQRNTAVLMLLLASGHGPILIDQPEEELDSSFLYDQLVPLLRGVKNERQIILVTHNPNLPVNGDAELVYALEARSQGPTGTRGVVRAQGGLDREEVKNSVLDVMEGSKEAFLRRREKYHY